MKKKIGELNGKPIVVGGENEVTSNEYHYSISEGIVVLKARSSDGTLSAITLPETNILETNLLDEEEIPENILD